MHVSPLAWFRCCAHSNICYHYEFVIHLRIGVSLRARTFEFYTPVEVVKELRNKRRILFAFIRLVQARVCHIVLLAHLTFQSNDQYLVAFKVI